MAISKRVREIVYQKYNGHCAYCGKEITIKEMQVDHFVPKMRGISDKEIEHYEDFVKDYNKKAEQFGYPKAEVEKLKRGTDDISNLMPACRQCNFRKGMLNIEQFRDALRQQAKGEMQRFQAKQSADYGLIEYHDHSIVFYFETYKVPTVREIELKLIDSLKCSKIIKDFGEWDSTKTTSLNLVRFLNKMWKEGRMMEIWNKLKEYGEV